LLAGDVCWRLPEHPLFREPILKPRNAPFAGWRTALSAVA
jgi:hypothetical protein